MAIQAGLTSLDDLVASPFARLAELLHGIAPGAPPIDLSLGEPRALISSFLGPTLEQHLSEFGRYPPIRGIPALRQAIAVWLSRRYPTLAAQVDAEAEVLPLNGSREGLFSAVFPALAREALVARPAVLIPNPFYQAYATAAAASGAEPVFLDSAGATQFLPALDAIDEQLLRRTVALYLCSPSNPQGAVADRDYLAAAIALARRFDFMLFADECYSRSIPRPRPRAPETVFTVTTNLAYVVTFNQLSKPQPRLAVRRCRRPPPSRPRPLPQRRLPAGAASNPAYRQSLVRRGHVEQGRALYRQNFDIADAVLQTRYGYRRPQGGFFLWLDMAAYGGGEEAVKTLWKGCGVRLLPGKYLARTGASGVNPGVNHVRVALVHDSKTTGEALGRIVATLG
jgi:aspartate/methionine/tyrosine aminotransferase